MVQRDGRSDTGGRLSSRLLFAAPQAPGLLLVAHTHLLGDVHQSARHRQTYADIGQLAGHHTHMHVHMASSSTGRKQNLLSQYSLISPEYMT